MARRSGQLAYYCEFLFEYPFATPPPSLFFTPSVYSRVHRFLIYAPSSRYSVSLITSLVLLIAGIRNLQIPRTFGNIWSLGFGEASEAALISWPGSQRPNIVPNAMLANLPHLTFSLIYFQWNAIITTMAIGREWNDFSLQRSGLRVSDTPQGEQRSRYFLQLPFKFSIPLIGTSIMLHWVLSQCIFIVSIETINRIEETGEISWGLITCGYSPVAIMTVLVISIIIPTSVYLIGRRRLPGPMPVAGSCSLAIAAACHHPDGRGHPDAALDRLKWGVMIDWKTQQGAEEPEQGQESQGLLTPASQYDHCGFSKDYIDEPIEGNQYA